MGSFRGGDEGDALHDDVREGILPGGQENLRLLPVWLLGVVRAGPDYARSFQGPEAARRDDGIPRVVAEFDFARARGGASLAPPLESVVSISVSRLRRGHSICARKNPRAEPDAMGILSTIVRFVITALVTVAQFWKFVLTSIVKVVPRPPVAVKFMTP